MSSAVLPRLEEGEAKAILCDYGAPAQLLRQVAYEYPGLRAAVANHPSAYPGLLDWLDAQGDPEVQMSVARRRDHDARQSQPPRQLEAAPSSVFRRPRRESGFGWTVLGFFAPIVGLLLWIVWDDAKPKESVRSRNGFIGSLVAGVLIVAGLIMGTLMQQASANDTVPPAAVTSVEPPDGDSQHAWITVPSPVRLPGALVVDTHTDYQSPTSAAAENAYGPLLKQLSDKGLIIWRQHSRIGLDTVLGNDWSARASIAAACVDVADSSKYLAYHLLIFTNQPKEGTGFTDAQLRDQWPADAGLTGRSLDTFRICYDNQLTKAFIVDGERSNSGATWNQSPPNVYTFGGNKPNLDADGRCSGTVGGSVGACGVPDFYVQGVEFSLNDLLNANLSPKITTPNALLSLLRRVAAS